jgi:hypothetical protein
MAGEERKPKIDLKARLGKAQGAAAPAPAAPAARPSGSVAPPPAIGSVPPPAAAGFGQAPGVPVGVPMPPIMGGKQQTDPFGAPVAVSPTRAAAPATIKIELDEETVKAARKSGSRAGILGFITLAFGGAVGFAWGSRSESAKGANAALQGAQDLIQDIDKAQGKIKEFSDKVGGAVKDMKDGKYPESFSNDLGGISIPFGADKLAGRNIGRFEAGTVKMLFNYASSVDALNDRKDALKNLFTSQKKAIVDALGQANNPKVSWVVFVQKSPAHGNVASLAAINPAESFGYGDKDWPAKFKISTGRELVDSERYSTGDPTTADPTKKIITIPVDPGSVSAAVGTGIVGRITSELAKTDGILSGTGTPGDDDENGVLKKGEALLTALKRIGQK